MTRAPAWSEEAVREDEIEIPVQVNGKVRSRLKVPAGAAEAEVKRIVMNDEKIKEIITGKDIRKFVYVQDKIVNMVVA